MGPHEGTASPPLLCWQRSPFAHWESLSQSLVHDWRLRKLSLLRPVIGIGPTQAKYVGEASQHCAGNARQRLAERGLGKGWVGEGSWESRRSLRLQSTDGMMRN